MVTQERKLVTIVEAERIIQESKDKEEAVARLHELKPRRQPRPPAPKDGISYMEAERKYGIRHGTIARWVKQGYIKILKNTSRETFISETQLQEIAKEYKKNPGQGRFTLRYLFGKNHPRAATSNSG